MECPFCNADIPEADFSAQNNPNLVTCQSCETVFFVDVVFEQFYAQKDFGEDTYTCKYSNQIN